MGNPVDSNVSCILITVLHNNKDQLLEVYPLQILSYHNCADPVPETDLLGNCIDMTPKCCCRNGNTCRYLLNTHQCLEWEQIQHQTMYTLHNILYISYIVEVHGCNLCALKIFLCSYQHSVAQILIACSWHHFRKSTGHHYRWTDIHGSQVHSLGLGLR